MGECRVIYFCSIVVSVFVALKARTAAGGERPKFPFFERGGGKWVPLDVL